MKKILVSLLFLATVGCSNMNDIQQCSNICIQSGTTIKAFQNNTCTCAKRKPCK